MNGEPAPSLRPSPKLAAVLVGLARDGASGALEIRWQQTSRRFGLLDGALVSAESSLRSEQLPARLTTAGLLDASQVQRAEDFARERGGTTSSALMSLRLLSPRALFEAIRGQIEDCAAASVSLPETAARFDPSSAPDAATRPFACDVLPIVHEGLLRHAGLDALYQALRDSSHRVPIPDPALKELVHRVMGDRTRAAQLLSRVDGHRPLDAIVHDLVRDPSLVVGLWIAERSGVLRYASAPSVQVEVIPTERASGPQDPHAGERCSARQPSAEAEGLRKEILALHERLDELDPYALLDVPRCADARAIRRAYLRAAKRFHPDKLARHGLAGLHSAAAEVFSAIASAHEVLTDPEARERHDAGDAARADLDASGDAGRIARAESEYRKAQILTRAGDFRGALARAEQSVALWPDEAAYHALVGWARFRKAPADAHGAAEALRAALERAPDYAQAHDWLSHVLRAGGHDTEADRHARRARQLDPNLG